MNKILNNKFNLLALGLITLLGIISRLNIINKSSLWYDEAFSGILVKQDLATFVTTIIQDKVHPPVYYILLKIWTSLVGNTDTTLRLFSLIFGVALIIAAFVLLKRLFNTKAAIIGSSIFALSPYFIAYSIEARSYIMLGFEALFAVYIFIKLYNLKTKTIKDYIKNRYGKALIGISLLMLLTHYISVVLILCFILLLITKNKVKLEKTLWIILSGALGLIILFGLTNNGSFRIISKDFSHTVWLEDGNLLSIGEMLYSFLFGVDSRQLNKQEVFNINFVQSLNTIFILLIIFILIASINFIRKKTDTLSLISKLLLLNMGLVTILCLAGINFFLPRYLMFLAIVFVVWISATLSRTSIKFSALTLAVYLLLLTQVRWVDTSRNFNNIADIQNFSATRRVVVKSPYDYLVLKYYLKEDRNLFFLDSAQWNMQKKPWQFFDKSQIVNRQLPNDYLI